MKGESEQDAFVYRQILREVWEQIRPCRLIFTAINDELRFWFPDLPDDIRHNITVHERIPRDELFVWMQRSRVVLAPSLMDGVPNTLYEAMAAGAAPIVSPLDTLVPLFENDKNVLYARNLEDEEIGAQLVRAMNDDALVDEIARNNLLLVRNMADRKVIAGRVTDFYKSIIQ